MAIKIKDAAKTLYAALGVRDPTAQPPPTGDGPTELMDIAVRQAMNGAWQEIHAHTRGQFFKSTQGIRFKAPLETTVQINDPWNLDESPDPERKAEFLTNSPGFPGSKGCKIVIEGDPVHNRLGGVWGQMLEHPFGTLGAGEEVGLRKATVYYDAYVLPEAVDRIMSPVLLNGTTEIKPHHDIRQMELQYGFQKGTPQFYSLIPNSQDTGIIQPEQVDQPAWTLISKPVDSELYYDEGRNLVFIAKDPNSPFTKYLIVFDDSGTAFFSGAEGTWTPGADATALSAFLDIVPYPLHINLSQAKVEEVVGWAKGAASFVDPTAALVDATNIYDHPILRLYPAPDCASMVQFSYLRAPYRISSDDDLHGVGDQSENYIGMPAGYDESVFIPIANQRLTDSRTFEDLDGRSFDATNILAEIYRQYQEAIAILAAIKVQPVAGRRLELEWADERGDPRAVYMPAGASYVEQCPYPTPNTP